MKALINLIKKFQAVVFPTLDVLLNGLNLFSQIYISWYITKLDFGVLNSSLAFLSVLIVLGISNQTYVARKISKYELEAEKIGEEFKRIFILAGLLSLAVILTSPLMKNFLRTDYISLFFIIIIFFVNSLLSFFRGILQGSKRFLYLNLSFYIEVPVKLALIIILIPKFNNTLVVLIATLIGMICALINDAKSVSKIVNIEYSVKIRGMYNSVKTYTEDIFSIILSNFGLYYLTSINLILVNYLVPSKSGDYAVAIKYTQLIIFVGFSIITVLVPIVARDYMDIRQFKKKVYRFMSGFFILGVLGLVVYRFLIPQTVDFLFGVEYALSKDMIFPQAIAYGFLVYSFFLISMEIVLEDKKHLKSLLVSVVLVTGGIIFFKDSIEYIIYTQIIVYMMLFSSLLIRLMFRSDNVEREKTKILFLSWRDIKAPKKGGAEVFTHEMFKNIDKNKFEIEHISPMFEGAKGEEYIDGVRYIRRGNIATVIPYAMYYYFKNRNEINFVVDQCNSHRFFTPFWVSSKKRIFFIHQMTREIWFRNMKAPFSHLGYYTEKIMTKIYKKNRTFTVSNSTKNDLIDMGLNSESIMILPEGIDFVPWERDDFLEKEKEYTFTYVGRYAKYKGIDYALDAFGKFQRKHPNSKLWIVGKKNQEYIDKHLSPIIKKYNLTESTEEGEGDVTYFGFVSDEKKLELMSKSHMLLFPSEREGWGLTVTEAAAVGTPSIVYKSAGLVDAVDNGRAGFLVKENTVDGIYKEMCSLVDMKDHYEEKRIDAHEFSKNFQWHKTANEFENYMEGIIRGEL